MKRTSLLVFIVTALLPLTAGAAGKIKVVVTISSYASIVKAVGGNKVSVFPIVKGYQDPHIVRPKPSLAVKLAKADLFVSTGLDLELWAPTIVDMSGNTRIRSGQEGYVKASAGLSIMERPKSLDRSMGDVHIFGNPHVHTSPINGKVIAENIYLGLSKIRPNLEGFFKANLRRFKGRIDRKLFGRKLLRILGGRILTRLARKGRLVSFLKRRTYKGKPMLAYLGGWMKKALPLRGRKLITYHPNWIYFTDLVGLEVLDFMEPKPGIPPSPRHVKKVVDKMLKHKARVILAANYFNVAKVRMVADKVGAIPVITSLAVGGEPRMRTFCDQFEIWIELLLKAFRKADGQNS